ncbi:MAG: hypothetical protein Q7S60_00675 [bacterium]|nr:hypothetical protein [bacterium]
MENGEGLVPDNTVSKPRLERITPEDIKPVVPEDGGSVFVLGINASDRANRKLGVDSPLFGQLDEGQAEATKAQYKSFFDGVFKDLTPEDRAKVDILVLAGNASLRMPGGIKNPHKRSMETSEHILAGAQTSMAEHGVNPSQLLNKPDEQGKVKPIEITSGKLLDLKMFDESPEFVNFLLEKYPDPKEFWTAYEEDTHKDVRERMGAEGPNDIADRVGDYMATLDNAMKRYHHIHPGRKAVVILNTQYDSAAPAIKKFVSEQPMEDFVEIEKRGGVVLEVGADGRMSANIQGNEYPVSFSKLPKIVDKGPSPEKTAEVLAKLKSEPLDPAKIEEVVNKYAEKHVQHKKGALIFAGSGSGKSTTVRGQAPDSEGKTDLVDADFIYKELGAHPMKPGGKDPEEWWHMSDEVIDLVEKRCAQINQVMIDKGLWALSTSFTPDDPYVPSDVVVVLLPWEEQQRRIIEKAKSDFYDGGAKATVAGFTTAKNHREWAERVAKEKNIPVVDSIEGALDLVRSRESS